MAYNRFFFEVEGVGLFENVFFDIREKKTRNK